MSQYLFRRGGKHSGGLTRTGGSSRCALRAAATSPSRSPTCSRTSSRPSTTSSATSRGPMPTVLAVDKAYQNARQHADWRWRRTASPRRLRGERVARRHGALPVCLWESGEAPMPEHCSPRHTGIAHDGRDNLSHSFNQMERCTFSTSPAASKQLGIAPAVCWNGTGAFLFALALKSKKSPALHYSEHRASSGGKGGDRRECSLGGMLWMLAHVLDDRTGLGNCAAQRVARNAERVGPIMPPLYFSAIVSR
jgi:hypothetical protein